MSLSNKLIKACHGKYQSQGGLNLPKFREELIRLLPQRATEISKATRSFTINFSL